MKRYTFSVIIPTFNRRDYLLDTLKSVSCQTIQPIEIIVVDASEKAFQLKEEEMEQFQPLLQYVSWDEYGNISKQRNFGISIAKGDIILFLDDDVVFGNTLFEDYVKAFDETDADGISGLIETNKYKKGDEAIKFKEVLSDTNELNIQACDYIAPTKVICTASFAIKSAVLAAVNGFDELQRGTYDDIELGFRLSKLGYKIIHHPEPIVFHIQAPASGARDIKHGNLWGVENQVYFMMKHIYSDRKKYFLFKLMAEVLKPSRAWLKPMRQFDKMAVRIKAYKRFQKLI
jgi:GT2 family glycosyltransferase